VLDATLQLGQIVKQIAHRKGEMSNLSLTVTVTI